MWVHVEVRCGGGFRWKQGIPRCTQIHTSLIVNQAYACATTNSTGAASPPGQLTTVTTPHMLVKATVMLYRPSILPWFQFCTIFNDLINLVQGVLAYMGRASLCSSDSSRTQTSTVERSPIGYASTELLAIAGSINTDIIFPCKLESEQPSYVQHSTTIKVHWTMKLVLYLASNNLMEEVKECDLEGIWSLVCRSGAALLVPASRIKMSMEITLAAAAEKLFGVALSSSQAGMISWLLCLGLDAGTPANWQGQLHLPLIVLMLNPRQNPNQVAYFLGLLLQKGASPLEWCCNERLTATHRAIRDGQIQIVDVFLQALAY
jgi:hypothetical protein